MGGTDTEYESAHKLDYGEENSPAAPAGIRTRNLSITSPTLYEHAIPASWTELALIADYGRGVSEQGSASENCKTTYWHVKFVFFGLIDLILVQSRGVSLTSHFHSLYYLSHAFSVAVCVPEFCWV